MNTHKTETKATRGRPTLGFNLPKSGKFTATSILNRLRPSYQKSGKQLPTVVTIHNHIKRAIAQGQVQLITTKSSGGRGRPTAVFCAA